MDKISNMDSKSNENKDKGPIDIDGYRDDMTVKEKVILGIQHAFKQRAEREKRLEGDPSLRKQEDLDTIMALDGIDAVDSAVNMPPYLEQGKFSDTINQYQQDSDYKPLFSELLREEEPFSPDTEKALHDEHIHAMKPFAVIASKRLNAAIGRVNEHYHQVPGAELPSLKGENYMAIVETKEQLATSGTTLPFHEVLENAKKASGYRKLTAAWLNLQSPHRKHQSFEDMITNGDDLSQHPLGTDVFVLPGNTGSITVTEVEIESTNWLVFEIEMPLAKVQGERLPPELQPMPTSRFWMLVPTKKVTSIVANADESESLGLRRMYLSKNGAPMMVTERKNHLLPRGLLAAEDYIQATNIPELRDPTKFGPSRGPNFTAEENTLRFWRLYATAAEKNRRAWIAAKKQMTRGECIMDLKVKEDWVSFPATKPPVPVSAEPEQDLPEAKPISMAAKKLATAVEGGVGPGKGKGRRRGSGKPAASGLRNEFKP